jgi:hypothetical protein
MQAKGFHRRLTAILSADVAGDSRLIRQIGSPEIKPKG